MKTKSKKTKLILIFFALIILIALGIGWIIVDGGYDKQNKYIILLKKIIPSSLSQKIRNTIFIIPDLKLLNKDLKLQVDKYEQGLNGELIEQYNLKFLDKNYSFKNFFLPFKSLDTRAGYLNRENTFRAHYTEVINDKILVVSGLAEFIYFDKKKKYSNSLNQKIIQNNLLNLLKKNNLDFFGIRDIYVEKNEVFISVIIKNEKGYSLNVYKSLLNFSNLEFETFFESNAFFENWSASTGGRIEKFKDDKILFSIGYSRVKNSPQDLNTLLGKIILIDKRTKKFEIVSMGHRNQQGLLYLDKFNLIINSEHGPMGGDEINFNYYQKNKIPNYGFDIVSYGVEYNGTDPYKRPHKKFGFDEPFKVYKDSIGISEILFLDRDKEPVKNNTLVVSSLRSSSLYFLEFDNDLKNILNETRVHFNNNRIRDIKYDKDYKNLYIIFEILPSIAIINFDN